MGAGGSDSGAWRRSWSRTRSSSAEGTTGWWRPRCWPTRGGTCVVLEAHGRRRRRGPVGRAAPRVHRRPVQRVLPARRGLPGAARAGAGAARAAVGARPGGAGPPAAPGRRTGRRAVPRPRAHRGAASTSSTTATATRGCGCARSGTVVGDPLLRTLFTAFPPVRGPVALLRRLGTAEALRLRPVRCCCRPAGWARSCSAARRPGCCWRATPCTPTRPPDAAGQRRLRLAAGDARPAARVPGAASAGAGQLAAALDRRAQAAGARRPHRPARRADRRPRRAGRRRAHRGGADRAGPPGGDRRRLRARALPAAAAGRRAAGAAARRPRALRVGHPGRQGQLGAGRADPVDARRTSAGAGTVHLGADGRGLVRWSADIESGTLPRVAVHAARPDDDHRPDPLAGGHRERVGLHPPAPRGRPTTSRPTSWRRRIDEVVEQHAPGFGATGAAPARRSGPATCTAADPNLEHGAVNGGTAQLFQQLVFRPVPGLGRAETVVEGLYLGSASVAPRRRGARACAATWPRRPRSASRACAGSCAAR